MVYIKFGDHYAIHQTAKLQWPPNILVVRYLKPSVSLCNFLLLHNVTVSKATSSKIFDDRCWQLCISSYTDIDITLYTVHVRKWNQQEMLEWVWWLVTHNDITLYAFQLSLITIGSKASWTAHCVVSYHCSGLNLNHGISLDTDLNTSESMHS